MFKVNDTIMYGHLGVYKIIDICTKNFLDEERLYYVLQPAFNDKTIIYCPVDTDKISLRNLLSLEDVHELIEIMPDEEATWIENDQLRKEEHTKILRGGDHKELIKLIKSLYFNRMEKEEQGKKFHIADEKAMEEAEKLLYQEFALVLDIEPEKVLPFITGKLEVDKKEVE